MSEQDLDIYCKIVEFRAVGKSNMYIGYKVGLTNDQVGNRISKLRYYFKHWKSSNNVLKRVCEKLDMNVHQVMEAINTRIRFSLVTTNFPINVKIKETISSTEIWYHSYRGKVLEVTKKDGEYFTNTPAKLRIKHQDCVEV